MPVSADAVRADPSWLIMAAASVVLELEVAEPGSEILSRDGTLPAGTFVVDSRAAVDSTMSADLEEGLADLEVVSADLAEGLADLEEGLVSEDSGAGLDLVLAADSALDLVSRFSALDLAGDWVGAC
jgi:hypothetical protein